MVRPRSLRQVEPDLPDQIFASVISSRGEPGHVIDKDTPFAGSKRARVKRGASPIEIFPMGWSRAVERKIDLVRGHDCLQIHKDYQMVAAFKRERGGLRRKRSGKLGLEGAFIEMPPPSGHETTG